VVTSIAQDQTRAAARHPFNPALLVHLVRGSAARCGRVARPGASRRSSPGPRRNRTALS